MQLSLPLLLLSLSAAVLGNTNYTVQAATIRSASLPLSGNGTYVFKNVATGGVLTFIREVGFGTNGSSVTDFRPVVNGTRALDIQVSNGTQLRLSGLTKCASAQWNVPANSTAGSDWAAVSYACVVGNGTTGTQGLVHDKQWWFAVPVATTLRKRVDLTKRAAQPAYNGSYYLITMDHISNMPARAMVGAEINTFGGYRSTKLDIWTKGTKEQMWTITKV